jgi:GTP-binding protein
MPSSLATTGLLGLKNAMLTATKGTAILNTHFSEYAPWLGDISVRELGSLTAYETGQVTTYALQSIEARGRLFVSPGHDIYEGQVSCCSGSRTHTSGES